ncbi:hypothetical protein [Flagellimonas amoyensis]|nr:hypothetical protein [Allomuricauda amoyensis]
MKHICANAYTAGKDIWSMEDLHPTLIPIWSLQNTQGNSIGNFDFLN